MPEYSMPMPTTLPAMAGDFEFARRAVRSALGSLHDGEILLRDGSELQTFGSQSDLSAQVTIHDHRLYPAVLWNGIIGAGDAYEQGWWSSDDLVSTVRILVRNQSTLAALNGGAASLQNWFGRLSHSFRRNTLSGSLRNIEFHYDLGNDFYSAWLDEKLVYSGGIFESDISSLEEAQIAKIERLCRLLQLDPSDHVLEIGCGWGAFAIHAARVYGCRVTATTISAEQYEYATAAVAREGLTDRIEILKQDYRALSGTYTKIVSVEMIEAVGHEYLSAFVQQCQKLLREDGLLALQLISMNDQHFSVYRKEADYIQRRIFPGSCLISISHLLETFRGKTDFRLLDLADFALDYARTLSLWRERFLAAQERITQLGFDEPFRRRWEFYLAYCEGGFRERFIGSAQLLLGRSGFRGGITR